MNIMTVLTTVTHMQISLWQLNAIKTATTFILLINNNNNLDTKS